MRGLRQGAACLLVLAGMAALSILRGQALDTHRGAYVGCESCFVELALRSDLWLLGVVALLLAAVVGCRSSVPRIVAGAAALLLLVAMLIDVGTSTTLGHRLLVADLRLYGTAWGAAWDVASPWLASGAGLAAIGALLLAASGLVLVFRHRKPASRLALLMAGVATAATAGAWMGGPPRYGDVAFYQNVLAIQALDSGLRHHADAVAERYYAMPAPAPVCRAWAAPAPPRNVFVLVLESWSLHHSALFSGLSDQTPRLDDWARRGRWFPELVANGFSTETALISLLNGHVPIPTHRSWGASAFDDVAFDWHRRLHAQGTWTGFFTTGGLGFGDRAAYLAGIGVQHMEGAEHPHYAALPRGAFDAASDRALMERVLRWYDTERPTSPFMATVLTVGSHPPFIDSESNDPHEPGEAAAIRRMDIAVSAFLEALEARGFFNDGLVFVTGDHRAMTPVDGREIERFGDTSASRVPGFVFGVGAGDRGAVEGRFQHTDLVPSLHALITGEDCRTPWQGRMFGPGPEPADVVVYSHPAWRNELRVVVGGETHRLRLDGDDTGWVGEAPMSGEALRDEVIRQRLSRDDRPVEEPAEPQAPRRR